MPDQPKGTQNPIQKFLALPPDSVPKTLFVAVTLCLVASMLVSSLAVSLRPLQEANQLQDKQKNILQVAGQFVEGGNISEAFAKFEPKVLEIATGTFSDQYDPATYDDRAAASDPALSIALENDPASIGRQAKFVTVYLLRDEQGAIDKVVLPVYGYGLWGQLYGYIAVEEDGNEIFGLQFYDHKETPGLGAEVDNPRWKALWLGKKVNDQNGDIQITVSKRAPDAGPDYHVDGLSGATLTTDGVHNLVRFWMGDAGFKPFLDNLKSGDV